MLSDQVDLPSAAVFGPQSKEPKADYLQRLRAYLCNTEELAPFVQVIRGLPALWTLYSNHNPDLWALSHGPQELQSCSGWIETGVSSQISKSTHGVVSIPLLIIVQVAQYFQFMREHRIRHNDLILAVQNGAGIQGYCSGLLTAAAVACSADEQELVQNCCRALRLAVGVGAYSDLGIGGDSEAFATIVIRMKYEGQAEDVLKDFPSLYTSATTDPKTITISGPSHAVTALQSRIGGQGLSTQSIHLGSKVHNAENADIATLLTSFCMANDDFRLPDASCLRADLRSNKTGTVIREGPLTVEVIDSILTSHCRWHDVMTAVSGSLQQTGRHQHRIATFGLADCIPLATFNHAGLQITKADMLVSGQSTPLTPEISSDYPYHPDAIAIVGMACRLPGANTVEELWDIISSGTSKVEEVPRERMDIHGSFRASQDVKWANKQKFFGNFISDIDAYDSAFFKTSPREALAMDPQQRLLLETAYQAMESSGYLRTHRREDGDRVGVYVGASFVDYLEHTSSQPPTAYTSTGTIRAFLCGKISYYFGWSGPSEVIDTACSSSLVAIRRAVKALQMDECSVALAGGVNLMSTPTNFIDLGKAGFLSPTGQCKPFDGTADGYCRSEGVGLIVLKRLSQAQAEGDNILGVIAGAQTNQGGLSSALTIPSSPSQISLYQDILQQAGLNRHQVSYVESHGTGTQAGDPLEIASIRQVFGGSQRSSPLDVGSIKANIGHCETAAGVAGLIKSVLMINKGSLPPLANFKSLNPKIPSLEPDRMRISAHSQKWDSSFRAICVNSYGAAGSNTAALLCQAPRDAEGCAFGFRKSLRLTYPIQISAASKNGVLMYAAALSKHISKLDLQCDVGALALSLDRRRKDRFSWTATHATIEGLVQSLEGGIDLDDVVEVSPIAKAKKVVMAFSGQTRQIVGLEKGVYESCHLFRTHLDACNHELMRLGFSSILPSVFDKNMVADTVLLHCGLFAVQYACAKSWMDSGLRVDAVVGHSFGELTALAVCGVLSLESALEIISGRATLMKTKWAKERGTMLVINGSADMVHDLISSSPVNAGDIEVACYNAHASQVVVGSDASITLIENFLRKNSNDSRLTFQRLAVSHGFHSQFTEPILQDLDSIAKSVDFHKPKIYLESCTSQPLDHISPSRIAKHTREPVFFHEAIQRIEKRLGSSVWLEAGFDSPIVRMIKKSIATPENHVFQGVGSGTGEDFLLSLSEATVKLWQEGIPVSHWSFSSAQKNNIKHMWLPPYQFEKTRHWLPYVDRAVEALQSLPAVAAIEPEKQQVLVPPPRLVTTQDSAGKFFIHTTCRTYVDLVSGHSVLRHPLCPASMYMECAAMGAQIMTGDIKGKALWFQGISIEAPLGVDSNREVTISLTKVNGKPQEWSFIVNSTLKTDPKARLSMHGKGKFGFMDSHDVSIGAQAQNYQRLVMDRVKMLSADPNTETLRKQRAYGLFSRIVNYGVVLKGIDSITLSDYEAIADIEIPPQSSQPSESTVTGICDTVILDNFIQVAGLLINSGNECTEDDAYLAIGVESIFISAACGFADCRSYSVYTTFTPLGEGRATADVFVLTKDGALVTTISGVKFAKLPLKKLHKLLDSANQSSSHETATKPKPAKSSASSSIPKSSVADSDSSPERSQAGPGTPATSVEDDSSNDNSNEGRLRELLAEFVDLAEGPIPDDTNMGELGVDSLGASELVENIQSAFDVEMDMQDIMDINYGQLCQRVGIQRGRPAQKPRAKAFSNDSAQPASNLRSTADQTQKIQQLISLIAEHSGTEASSIDHQSSLEALGVDSLSLVELKSDIEDLGVEFPDDDLNTEVTVAGIIKLLGEKPPSIDEPMNNAPEKEPPKPTAALLNTEPAPAAKPPTNAMHTPAGSSPYDDLAVFDDPMSALAFCGESFDVFASKRGFSGYWEKVAPKQDELMLAYIAEAFKTLGVDMWMIPSGAVVPQVQFLPRHSKLMRRLWAILERLGIITRKESVAIRTSKPISTTPSAALLAEIISIFPEYAGENDLMAVTGSKLADCLTGKADAVRILFGNQKSQELLNAYYGDSPQLSVATDMLVDMMKRTLSDGNRGVVRILETGGGFGGTTTRFAQLLDGLDRRIQYTFTDMSPKLVRAASTKLSRYSSWMDFQTLDLEKEPAAALQGKYDIVLGTNVVHATSDIIKSCTRIRSLLRDGGFMILSEVTRILDWYDLVFGLLEGWWLATDGRDYPLQSPEAWLGYLKDAGFSSCSYSGGSSEEANTQSLIVGSTVRDQRPAINGMAPTKPAKTYNMDTYTYKIVDGLEIQADVYYPKEVPSSKPMPIALMVHGGSFMTFSKNIIRPWQIPLLLQNGFLPVSLDHRLCPETTLAEGPMADVRDGFAWARKELANIANKTRNFTLDSEKVVVVGWSTGATLAMSTAWTALDAGVKPPEAILNFYGPSDFESEYWSTPRKAGYPKSTMPADEIARNLFPKPIVSYDVPSKDAKFGGMHPGDPRSQLVFYTFNSLSAVSIFTDGFSPSGTYSALKPDRVAAISPLAQVRKGTYKVPTFIVHGDQDEIVPVNMSREFEGALKEKGIRTELLVVKGKGHIFDLFYRPGREGWDQEVVPGYEFLVDVLRRT
ncbi:MAG: Type I Iterative PKS [Pycnora praestabilis]|nr:MAG: Type I Iterative PKS [Pycnora praestabilis]